MAQEHYQKLYSQKIEVAKESPRSDKKNPKKVCKKSVFRKTAKITQYFESKIEKNATKMETISSKNRILLQDSY